MKTSTKSLAIIILAVMIGLSMSACDNPSNSTPPYVPAPLDGWVSIVGVAQVGQPLTADISAITGTGYFSFQWMRGDVSIGTNSNTYIAEVADVGQGITVTVTRSGNPGSITSDPVLIMPREDITISFADLDRAPDIPIIGPTLSLTSSLTPNITVTNPWQYDTGSIRWFFQGTQITGSMISGTSGERFTLGLRIHDTFIGIGTHFLTVEVSINGVPYSRRIAFTVTP